MGEKDGNITAIMEQLPRSDYLKELNKRKEIEEEALTLQRLPYSSFSSIRLITAVVVTHTSFFRN